MCLKWCTLANYKSRCEAADVAAAQCTKHSTHPLRQWAVASWRLQRQSGGVHTWGGSLRAQHLRQKSNNPECGGVQQTVRTAQATDAQTAERVRSPSRTTNAHISSDVHGCLPCCVSVLPRSPWAPKHDTCSCCTRSTQRRATSPCAKSYTDLKHVFAPAL